VCGIVGILVRDGSVDPYLDRLAEATARLVPRGPDRGDRYVHRRVALGHRRLAIIDTSPAGDQPMTDETGRYTIVYNGELYNFRELRQGLIERGATFKSNSDSEVMLKLFIARGAAALDEAVGFFAFAVYDAVDESLFLARDRFGIKPLYYYQDENSFLFASELKSVLAFPTERRIDDVSLFQYLQLSYIPAPYSILEGVKKLEPGCYLETDGRETALRRFYRAPNGVVAASTAAEGAGSYDAAVDRVRAVLDEAVRMRLVSDVPLGAFLSGGVDSTVVAALAARHMPGLNTFSIGFRQSDFYDETPDALDAARNIGTNHTVFLLSNADLYESLFDVLDHLDEPFADSSALAVYILSRRTREHVKVALSGDGADELLGGYNKHYAEYRARRGGVAVALVTALRPLWNALPASRDSATANRIRQLARFSRAARLPAAQRYWEWCKFTGAPEALAVMSRKAAAADDAYRTRFAQAVAGIRDDGGMNDVLHADVRLVLPNDMLHKVDSMSMANSLEVRVPYLDHRFVELCFSLPARYKITDGVRKRILRDAFAAEVPERLLRKPKHGFEVPLMKWFRTGLRSLIDGDLLADDFVSEQGIFVPGAVANLRKRLWSARPGDIAPLIWALIVFQHWWRKYMN
jgi:asparagine synthase (glutamine-hydrolysing)